MHSSNLQKCHSFDKYDSFLPSLPHMVIWFTVYKVIELQSNGTITFQLHIFNNGIY